MRAEYGALCVLSQSCEPRPAASRARIVPRHNVPLAWGQSRLGEIGSAYGAKEMTVGEQKRPDGEHVEGPEPGSSAMENLVHSAEDKADENVADKAGKEQDRQMQEGEENAS